jgi:hypothetical protein
MSKKDNKKKLQNLIEDLAREEVEIIYEQAITSNVLYQAFIQPFMDVINTAKAEATKLIAITKENVKKTAKQALYLVLPTVAASAIKEAQQEADRAISEKIKAVNDEYKEVYQRTWDTLRSSDAFGLLFLLGPALPFGANFTLAYRMMRQSPLAVLSMFEMLSGGDPRIANLRQRYTSTFRAPVAYGGGMKGAGPGYAASVGWGDIGPGSDIGESYNPIREQEQQQKRPPSKDEILKKMTQELQQILKSPDVKAKIANNAITKDFQQAGIKAITATLEPVLKANDYDTLKNIVGPQQFAKMEAEIKKSMPQSEKMTPELEQQFEQQFVDEFKNVYKTMIVNQLKQAAEPGTEKIIDNIIQQISKA